MALSFLNGPPLFEVILRPEDVDRLMDGVADAVKLEGRRLLERLGQAAVDTLQAMESGVGRRWLAPRWRKGPVRKFGDALHLDVYNEAEGKTFRNTDWRGVRTSAHTITGKRLLAILEGGAKPHRYGARDTDQMLVFMSPRGGHRSFTKPLHAPKLVAAYLYGDGRRDRVAAAKVDHPGVRADHFVTTTKRAIEERLATEAAAAAKNVAVNAR